MSCCQAKVVQPLEFDDSRWPQLPSTSSTEYHGHSGALFKRQTHRGGYLPLGKRSIMAVRSLSVASHATPRLALLHLCTHIHRVTVPVHLLIQLNNSRYRSSSLSNRPSKPLLVVPLYFLSPSFLQFEPLEPSRAFSCLFIVDTYAPMAVSPELLCVAHLAVASTRHTQSRARFAMLLPSAIFGF